MLTQRKGFTLIELLIVIVIIGILAAIAIPKFSQVKEQAYFSAMTSDLKNLVTAQEIYFGNSPDYSYTDLLAELETFQESKGVEVSLTVSSAAADPYQWYATASHTALDPTAATQYCGVYVGNNIGSNLSIGVVPAASGAPICNTNL